MTGVDDFEQRVARHAAGLLADARGVVELTPEEAMNLARIKVKEQDQQWAEAERLAKIDAALPDPTIERMREEGIGPFSPERVAERDALEATGKAEFEELRERIARDVKEALDQEHQPLPELPPHEPVDVNAIMRDAESRRGYNPAEHSIPHNHVAEEYIIKNTPPPQAEARATKSFVDRVLKTSEGKIHGGKAAALFAGGAALIGGGLWAAKELSKKESRDNSATQRT